MDDKRKSVILLSGGLDSSANLAFCHQYDEVSLALTLDYGQRAAANEVKAAAALAKHFNVPHKVMDVKWLGDLGGSSLTDNKMEVPSILESELDEKSVTEKTAKSVWVPNRNGLFVHIAAALAESMNAKQVVVGFNREEAETFPDNSSQYLQVLNLALRYSTRNHVKVSCYTDMLDKRQIVDRLKTLSDPFPFELLWSCYLDGDNPCGKCESCKRYSRAVSG